MIEPMRIALVGLFFILCAASPCANSSDQTFLSIPFDYDVHPGVTYIHRSGWEGKLDLLIPGDGMAAKGTLVWFHGGGWTRSSKDQELLYVLPYLYRRWSVINVEYRLANVANAPAAASDALCAMRWLTKHRAEYNLPLDRLVVSGISAGGAMALFAGTISASSPLALDCGSEDQFGEIPVPRVIVNWFGPSNLVDLIEGPHRQTQVVAWFENIPDRIGVANALSPVMYIRSAVPPVITIHGENDESVPFAQSVALHRLLTSTHTPNRLVRIRAGHGDFTAAQAAYSYDEVFAFINKILRK